MHWSGVVSSETIHLNALLVGPPHELFVLEQSPARFDLVLGRALKAYRSTEGLKGHSAMEPMSVKTAGPTVAWQVMGNPFHCMTS